MRVAAACVTSSKVELPTPTLRLRYLGTQIQRHEYLGMVLISSQQSPQDTDGGADTVRTVEGYADCLVLRHYESGSAYQATTVAGKPIISAGDGPGQHPTQVRTSTSSGACRQRSPETRAPPVTESPEEHDIPSVPRLSFDP